MNRILVVDDEPSFQQLLKINLEEEGFNVTVAEDGRQAINYVDTEAFDLVILDVMLPHMDGMDICRHIRFQDRHTPVMFLTARDEAEDRIKGLKIGGDDYLTKPFELEEMLLRVRNLIDRTSNKFSTIAERIYTFGENEVDLDSLQAKGRTGTISLTKIEARLLKTFIEHEGEVLSRKQLLHWVWGYDVFPTTRTIDNFILAFRKYFEANSRSPEFFLSVRGVGYKFVNPTHKEASVSN